MACGIHMYAAKFRSLERYSAHNRIETEGKGYDDDKDARKDVRWFVVGHKSCAMGQSSPSR